MNVDLSRFSIYFPCQSTRLTQTESRRPDGGLNCNLGARALLLMRGLGSALELLRTSRSDDQQRATRVGLATNGAQRRSHGLAHAPSESGARHSRDLRGGPREREVEHVPLLAGRASLYHARMICFSRSWRSTRWCSLVLGHERADAPRPFEATWRARKSTTSATGIAVSTALCVRLAALPTLRGPPRRYRPRDTRQARARRPSPAAAHAQRR